MSIPFARSIRSMDQDRGLPAGVLLALVSLLVLSWLGWFFAGRLPVYAVAQSASVTPEGLVAADFPGDLLPALRPGQPVELQLAGAEGQPGAVLRGELLSLPVYPGDPVLVYPLEALPGGEVVLQGVRVQTGSISPFARLYRSPGQVR